MQLQCNDMKCSQWCLGDWWEWGEQVRSAYIHLKWLEIQFKISCYSFSLWWLVYARITHESILRLNLCMSKLGVEEMCSSCVSIAMLHLPFYIFERLGLGQKFIWKLNIVLEVHNFGYNCDYWWWKLIITMNSGAYWTNRHAMVRI